MAEEEKCGEQKYGEKKCGEEKCGEKKCGEEKYVVVVGKMGVGKSYFINEHVVDDVPHSDSPDHVTRITKPYRSKDDSNLWFMDTVGIDKDGIPFDQLKGKSLCYLVIISSLRVNDEKEEIEKKIGTTSPCMFYYRHGENRTDLPSIDSFETGDIPSFEVAYHVVEDPPAHRRSSKEKKKKIVESPLFKKHKKLSETLKNKLLMVYENAPLQIMNQEVMTDQDLKGLGVLDVTKYRHRGESILKYLLQCTEYKPEKVQNKMSNEDLAKKVRSWNLHDHLSVLYEGNELNNETLADYIEALFGYTYAKEPRKIVDLLVKIVD